MIDLLGVTFGWESIVAILAIVLTLKWFYQIYQISWPEYYFSINDKNALFVRHSIYRFLLFRLLPPFVIELFYLTVFLRESPLLSVVVVAIISMLIYIVISDGNALIQLIYTRRNVKVFFNKPSQIIFHIIVMAFLVAISYGCAILSKNGTALLIFPSIKPLIDNMWAAFIGFLLASFAREALSNRSISESTVINDALQEINPKIFALIDKLADKANANPNLIKAVAVTENLQRPAWFRLIEQIMSWFSKKGTYGIMQVQSDRYLTDEESIEIAINKYFVNTKNASNEEIEAILTKYNPSTTYQDIVLKTMRYLLPG